MTFLILGGEPIETKVQVFISRDYTRIIVVLTEIDIINAICLGSGFSTNFSTFY